MVGALKNLYYRFLHPMNTLAMMKCKPFRVRLRFTPLHFDEWSMHKRCRVFSQQRQRLLQSRDMNCFVLVMR